MTKVVFLDRDGVINKYPGHRQYVTNLKGFKFLPGSLSAIRILTNAGFKIFVVSNQAGVSKRLYSKKTLDKITRFMIKEVKKTGGRIQKVLYCIHREETNCFCRKPKTGLLKKATKDCKVDLKDSYFIGDSLIDVATGKTFGCKTILVFTGREKLKNAPDWDIQPDFVAKTLKIATENITAGKYNRA
jgi:D-glycero-D-manno-heptose 1,7-bisphosphate phosphatase